MSLLNRLPRRVGGVGVHFWATLRMGHFGERVCVGERRMATTEGIKVYHIGAVRKGCHMIWAQPEVRRLCPNLNSMGVLKIALMSFF